MNYVRYSAMLMCIAVAACTPTTPDGESEPLSEEIRALAAPGQDLTRVRIESDGCYWYLHTGPVEQTFLPLLTSEGRMICVRPQGTETA